jgi:2-keto-4-pentenoate hydratase/2-oxohepta-3-ene-1,7-dioic acid hydratase in catechol pathway
MNLVTFVRSGGSGPAEAGVLMDGGNVAALGAAGYPDMISIARGAPDSIKAIGAWLAAQPSGGGAEVVKAGSYRLLAPVPRPPKVICVGLNYRDHAEESNMEIPQVPTIFAKFPTAVIGPGDKIVLPKSSTKPDYEAEFAVVIGKGGRYIKAENWREAVLGYTIVNDVSARDYQMATTQWVMGKTFDTFCPMGPQIVTGDELTDPHTLDISLEIGGETLQKSNTRHLIFGVPRLVEYLSSVFTLEPGDIISTGTPAGVGFARKPPRWLKAGEEVVVRVQGIGELRNPVVEE